MKKPSDARPESHFSQPGSRQGGKGSPRPSTSRTGGGRHAPKVFMGMKNPVRLMTNRAGKGEYVMHEVPCGILIQCGACPLLDLDYKSQLAQKTADLREKVAQAGEWLATAAVHECLESPDKLGYRHTAKLVVSERIMTRGDRWIQIGLYRPGSHEVTDISRCPVQSGIINDVTAYLRTALRDHKVSVYNPVLRQGLVRYVILRTSRKTKQTIVTFIVTKADKVALRALALEMASRFSQIQGVLMHINDTEGNAIFKSEEVQAETDPQTAGQTICLAGNDALEEHVAGLELKISSTSFFQVNPLVAEKMYFRVAELADLSRQQTALDLYCGVGGITLSLASHAGRVLAIDETPSSIRDLEHNAKANNMANVQAFTGRAETILPEIVANGLVGRPDVVTINPSRRGCQPEVLQAVSDLKPKAIIYMSCFPDTLLRDLKILAQQGYKARLLEPYDMFPGTRHFEVLAYLTPG